MSETDNASRREYPDLSPDEIRAGINVQFLREIERQRSAIRTLLTILRDLGTYSVQGAIIAAELNERITKSEADAVRRLLNE